MIPPVVMYVLGAVLVLFGGYRVMLGTKSGAKARRMHLVFGVLYVVMGLFLILTTARIIPAPRFGPAPRRAPVTETTVKVLTGPLPSPSPGASQPSRQP
jgi:hypothetical protein